jgi:hypothetical protein
MMVVGISVIVEKLIMPFIAKKFFKYVSPLINYAVVWLVRVAIEKIIHNLRTAV